MTREWMPVWDRSREGDEEGAAMRRSILASSPRCGLCGHAKVHHFGATDGKAPPPDDRRCWVYVGKKPSPRGCRCTGWEDGRALDALRSIEDPDEVPRCVDCGVEVDGLGPPICRECGDDG